MKKLIISFLSINIFLIIGCESGLVYTEVYKEANDQKANFEIPEVNELAEIATTLTGYSDKNRSTSYAKEVEAYFGKYKSHPLIDKLKSQIKDYNNDYDLRMGAFAHEFDANDKIVAGFYPYSKFGDGKNKFKDLKADFEDFAKTSDFRTFYKNHKAQYEQMTQKQATLMPVRKMWDWLEERFPDRSQSFKIIFSPLFGGNHNTVWFNNNGFRESIFFVSYIGENFFVNSNNAIREGNASRIVFTEIDHNYVNPISDRNKSQIEDAIKNVSDWNKGQGYSSELLTFNEYMTWAVFILYASDNYEKADFEAIKQEAERVMGKNRGFVKFKDFSDNLLAEYQKNKTMKSDEMFKIALDWMENN
jgi:hypothetical protein